MESGARLTPEQVITVITFHDEVAKLRGLEKADWEGFTDSDYKCLIGSHNLVQILGGGDPVKAAQVRRKMETGQDWQADLSEEALTYLPKSNS
jgi:hypothetical protein